MGNKISSERLLFDRVIDGEEQIYIGVNGNKNQDNPMSTQKIHLGDFQYKNLHFFTSTPTNLTYEFEDNVMLRFYKNEKNEVFYNIKCPEKNIDKTKIMNEICVKNFKKIEFHSNEFDKIYDFIVKK